MRESRLKDLGFAAINLGLAVINGLYVFTTPFPILAPLHVVFVIINAWVVYEYILEKR